MGGEGEAIFVLHGFDNSSDGADALAQSVQAGSVVRLCDPCAVVGDHDAVREHFDAAILALECRRMLVTPSRTTQAAASASSTGS